MLFWVLLFGYMISVDRWEKYKGHQDSTLNNF